MFAGKPILGIVGGVGSGKSYVADLFGQLGCLVIKSDDVVHSIYRDPDVLATLTQWWGDGILTADGKLDRAAVGKIVFSNPAERKRLEEFVHPRVLLERDRVMRRHAGEPGVRAFVWDTPLLIEAGLHGQCDAVVFIDAPESVRQQRVRDSRGWDAAELARRESAQFSLGEKRRLSTHVMNGDASRDELLRQAADVLATLTA